jgi:RES domain
VKKGSRRFHGQKRRLEFRLRRTAGNELPPLGPESLLLDAFTDVAAAAWERQAPLVQEYHYRFFFELEAQRAAVQDRMREALATSGTQVVNLQGWGRALDWQYCLNPLSAVGSLKWVGGRFNFGAEIDAERFSPFPALYLAEDLGTALAERLGAQTSVPWSTLSVSDLAFCGESSFTWVSVAGEIKNVFDLTGTDHLQGFVDVIKDFQISAELRALEAELHMRYQTVVSTSDQLLNSLMSDTWRALPTAADIPANPQVFGKLLCSAGFEGVLYRSVHTNRRNLAVFTRQLVNSESEIHVQPPQPPGVILVSLNSTNWRHAEKTYEELCG